MQFAGALGPMSGKKALNAICDSVTVLGNILNQSAASHWKFIILAKLILDLYPLLSKLFEIIMNCVNNGSSEKDIKLVINQFELIFDPENMLLNLKSTWLKDSDLDASLVKLLTPNAEGIFESFDNFFTNNVLFDRLNNVTQSNDLLEKFTNLFLENKNKILTDLEPILIDWSKGKDLVFKFDGLVETARKKEQGIGDKKAAELSKELQSMKRKYETIRTEKSKTDKICDSLVKEIDVLRFIEEELIKERKISSELHSVNAELKSTSDTRKLKLNALEIELAQFKQTVASLTEELRTTKDSRTIFNNLII